MDTFTLRNLSFSYPGGSVPALSDLSLSVAPGEFLVLCGESGCGKSTLLRQLKPALTPHGTRSGEILFEGQPLSALSPRQQAGKIGFVLQNPDNQIVTDKVWHELAFGLESLGCDTPTIRRRVAEMASFFGIQTWFYKNVTELSGGQKQLLNLASVMVLQPDVLILDEPTSQLDPSAALDFLTTVGRINRELGTTVILTEHRLEEAFSMASRVAVMEKGRLLCAGTPAAVGKELRELGHTMFQAMPAAMRLWAAVENDLPCPVTVREGRDFLRAFAENHPLTMPAGQPSAPCHGDLVCEARELWFQYEPEGQQVVKGCSLALHRGEFLALLGGNGAGKTTALKLLAGLMKPQRGSVVKQARTALLPQDPQSLFVKKTVREDLFEILNEQKKLSREEKEKQVARAVALCHMESLLDRHPYDLSGGEQQRAALCKILLLSPEILLLDEPTKGLDAEFKQELAGILETLLQQGVAILMVSHDIEFCAEYAHRCALFFDGSIVTEGTPRQFFSGNTFYTTAANRMAREHLPAAVTVPEVIAACGGTLPTKAAFAEVIPPLPEPAEETPDWKPERLPRWRRLTALVSGTAALLLFLQFLGVSDLTGLVQAEGISGLGMEQLRQYGVLIALLTVFAVSIGRRTKPAAEQLQPPEEKRKLQRRTRVAAVLILLLIPLTLFVGEYYLGGRKYYFISLLILLETMLPFLMIFEGRKPKARELVIIAVLCALGVAGRAAFFMLPQFKPVMALTIIAGVAFGGETGFLVGAMTMLVSNALYGQGIWTPWQMFAMGIIGFLAGILFRKGFLRRSRGALCIFGALAALLIYGIIMNSATALLWMQEWNFKILLTYWVTGFFMDCIQAAATVIFLWFGAEPMLEKLERIKTKYGLVE